MNTRLFNVPINGSPFVGAVWEGVTIRGDPLWVPGVQIKHFVPNSEAIIHKNANWYRDSEYLGREIQVSELIETWQKIPPSRTEQFSQWKRFNPQRDNYI